MSDANPFAEKIQALHSLTRQLSACLNVCPYQDQEQLSRQLQWLKAQCAHDEAQLGHYAAHSQLAAAARLAQAQAAYLRQSADVLAELNADAPQTAQEQDQYTQTLLLYTEYAVDFAAMAIRHAFLADLHAASAQSHTHLTTKEPH